MRKFKAIIGLSLVRFGIKIFESQPFGLLDNEDKNMLQRLWSYHDIFEARL